MLTRLSGFFFDGKNRDSDDKMDRCFWLFFLCLNGVWRIMWFSAVVCRVVVEWVL